jgi:hypothetical protein
LGSSSWATRLTPILFPLRKLALVRDVGILDPLTIFLLGHALIRTAVVRAHPDERTAAGRDQDIKLAGQTASVGPILGIPSGRAAGCVETVGQRTLVDVGQPCDLLRTRQTECCGANLPRSSENRGTSENSARSFDMLEKKPRVRVNGALTNPRNLACFMPSSAMIKRDDHGKASQPLARCRPRRISMDNNSTISVTLSADLLSHLRLRAQNERTPLSWLVAGLVCDTIVARKTDTEAG